MFFRFLALMLLLVSRPVFAADPVPDELVTLIGEELDRAVPDPDGPGAVVTIANGQTVLFAGARGRASIELDVPLSPHQRFKIASVTKMFTAALVMQFAEEGLVDPDAPYSEYLPDFAGGERYTVRQLLNHTAGISDRATDPQPFFVRRDVPIADRLEEFAQRPLLFAPGSDQAYSNTGYIMLGALIERVTGQSWDQALSERLLVPLGLDATQYGMDSLVIPDAVEGYTHDRSGAVRRPPFMSSTIPASAGALVSGASDLTRWMQALAHGEVIGRAGFEQMASVPDLPTGARGDSYGLGMYVWRVRGQPLLAHTGQIGGFGSALGYLPSQDATIVVLANDDTFDTQTFLRRLTAIALGNPYPSADPMEMSSDDLSALAGDYRIDENSVRSLVVSDGQLFIRSRNGNLLPAAVTAEGTIHFIPDELSYFRPVRDEEGRVTHLEYYEKGEGPPMSLPRTD